MLFMNLGFYLGHLKLADTVLNRTPTFKPDYIPEKGTKQKILSVSVTFHLFWIPTEREICVSSRKIKGTDNRENVHQFQYPNLDEEEEEKRV